MARMRISARADYAIQALAYMAASQSKEPVKAEEIADAQSIPLKFLLGILGDLKNAQVVRSQRGAQGGFMLSRDAAKITLAEVIRLFDGPLANVRDQSLRQLSYAGPAALLAEVWMAVRASLKSVLEVVSIADLASGTLPKRVRELAARYEADIRDKS
jgi:Rrf2 family protein